MQYLDCLKLNETLFFVSSLKSRCGLKKISSKNIEKIWSKNILKIYPNFFENPEVILYGKMFDEIFSTQNYLRIFKIFENIFWRNFQNIFSTKIFQNFSMIFFINHIYSSRTTRKSRFWLMASNIFVRKTQKTIFCIFETIPWYRALTWWNAMTYLTVPLCS